MDPADPLLPKILVLVILILINAFFAAAEIAVISLSETKLRKQAEEGDKKAKKLLVDNKRLLDILAMHLYEKETITGDEFMQILNAQDPTQE